MLFSCSSSSKVKKKKKSKKKKAKKHVKKGKKRKKKKCVSNKLERRVTTFDEVLEFQNLRRAISPPLP